MSLALLMMDDSADVCSGLGLLLLREGKHLFQLIYTSRAAVRLTEPEMRVLLGASRSRNKKAGITGLLVQVSDGTSGEAFFLQLIEGSQESVRSTYSRIGLSMLHDDLRVVLSGEVAERSYGAWEMLAATITTTALEELLDHTTGRQDPNNDIFELLQDSSTARTVLAMCEPSALWSER